MPKIPQPVLSTWTPEEPFDWINLPASWNCLDCGRNTAPGFSNRAEIAQAIAKLEMGGSVAQHWTCETEVYCVRESVWQKTGLGADGGCLCIRCLEKRLGRQLRPKDFMRNDPLNSLDMPGTELRWRRLSAGKPR